MASDRTPNLDDPEPLRRKLVRSPLSGDAFGRGAEGFARFMGTPAFLVGMTVFCAVWLVWNSLMPESAQFDPRSLNFTLLTLILSLQASYAAPLLLLAQNRQDDRDRVQAEQDRQSNDRNHATTDFITREIASLRIALNDVATRDFVRSELRDLLESLEEDLHEDSQEEGAARAPEGTGTGGSRGTGASMDPTDTTRAPAEGGGAEAPAGIDREELRAMLRSEVRAALAERRSP
ncbi:DUF1003 domain-containing protein [Brachybacterium endophyticum]|uniref:DUF1003 domain-containing protein n=2 Tax=Brachybacterium endophyticum TaxID=2182385 RepID=A0A2U2RLS0_9MICO|nr:DUF1003 domain-containing protein [Brachybacterium endophyticum]PWH06827.1 DUF1003 domain-containing protein [Brachybacterium endophyticum]